MDTIVFDGRTFESAPRYAARLGLSPRELALLVQMGSIRPQAMLAHAGTYVWNGQTLAADRAIARVVKQQRIR